MFTGIVEAVGTIGAIKRGAQSSTLKIVEKSILEDIRVGDSIAVNGVCLTVIDFGADSFSADVMHETLNRSTLENLHIGNSVNLERALPANGRFGGHIVSGHIDGTGIVTKITKDDNAVWYNIKAPSQIMKYIVEKGSIAIDGVSLTVAEIHSDNFSVSIIPHTVKETTFSEKNIGDSVNLENDIVGKYVERFLKQEQEQSKPLVSNITKDYLERMGY